jgi:type II secretory pathway component PulM
MISLSALHIPSAAFLKRMRRIPWADLRMVTAFWARLSPREQRFVGAAAAVLGATLLYLLVVDPVWEAHNRLRARVATKERELGEVMALSRTYRLLHQEVEKNRPAAGTSISPLAFLESLTSNTVGRDKVTGINPSGHETRAGTDQETVELTLSGVSLRELVELLYKIDTASVPLRTVRLSIKKRYKDPYTFDVSLATVAISAR